MSLPDTMRAMVTMGHGGFDMLEYRTDWPRPEPGTGEVLIHVGACGLNNTDINTREGWYSKAVTGATGSAADTGEAPAADDPSWGGAPVSFPRIQGADACGRIVAVGDGVDANRIGERVITDNYLRDLTFTGSTVIDLDVMPNLIGYIERRAIQPVLAATHRLTELRDAQEAFITKTHTGNIVVEP